MKRACAATVAASAAVALAAGMTSPASAKPEQRATGAAQLGAAQARLKGDHRITLITGDRVTVDAKGRVAGLEPAKGREHIPVQVRKLDGHTLVIPVDADRLIASGKLDQRLFDVTELNKSAERASQKAGLKVIVGYQGAATATKADVRDAGRLRQSLKTLNADAVQTPRQDTAELWKAVTNGDQSAAGIAHVWLDGVRKASLDKSVPQIGAPKAWAAGYTGKGVKIAVLDTGVDADHPDLKTQVIESKNFSTAADANDHFGHGTHVASIAAGTGAKSNGKYKGVAPDAKILNGKVLDDTGSGDDSGILAGMEWAAQQGADIVNLSLGGQDTPGIDPLEAEVNKLSTEKGILFAIAAGNEGPQSIGSPGSADAAITVGAVDGNDKLADFSSTGPRVGDGAIKPDVTAPGVDITAAAAPGSVIDKEVGENPPGYLTISGTSMATPHVAGAAAILKQEHPTWGYAELKGALTGSAKGGNYTPFQQGSGRIAVDKAIKQSVIADPVSESFGVQQWPHTDDTPVTKQVTYRNLGTTAVTLKLAVAATNPKGQTAPSGFFKLAKTSVTVPAGGTASVGLTVNTKLGGTLDGAYSAYVTATGGGQSVRTAAAVVREVQSYDLTLKFINRDGSPAKYYTATVAGLSGLGAGGYFSPYDESGTVKVRVPKGGYVLDTGIFVDPEDFTKGADWIAQPKLDIAKNTSVTIDARTAKPVDITVPDTGAKSAFASPGYTLMTADSGASFGWFLDTYANFRSAHLGPQITDGSLSEQWDAHFTKGTDEQYDTTTGGKVKQLATGFTKHYKATELATVKARMGAAASGKTGLLLAFGYLPDVFSSSATTTAQPLPGTRVLHVSTTGGVQWELDFEQDGARPGRLPGLRVLLRLERPGDLQGRPDVHPDLQHGGLRPAPRRRLRRVPRRQRDLRDRAAVRRLRAARGLVAVHLGQHDPVPQRHEGGLQPGPAARPGGVQGPGRQRLVQADHFGDPQRQGRRSLHPDRRELDVLLEEAVRCRRGPTPRLHGPLQRDDGPGQSRRGRQEGDDPGHRRGRGSRPQPQVPGRVGVVRLRPDLEEGQRRQRQDHRHQPGQGQGHFVPREDRRQEGQQVDDLDLQRVLRQVSCGAS